MVSNNNLSSSLELAAGEINEGSILIVDDEPAICEIISRKCIKLGYSCLTALNGREALNLINDPNIKIDAIISDISMPILDGIELISELRIQNVQIPVLILTGHGSIKLLHEALRLGAFDFIEKPFDEFIVGPSLKSAVIFKNHRFDLSPFKPFNDFNGFKSALSNYIFYIDNLLKFSISSLDKLKHYDKLDLKLLMIEISYLLRLARDFSFNFIELDLHDLNALCTLLTENLIQIRTETKYIKVEKIQSIHFGFHVLIQSVKNLIDQNSIEWKRLEALFKLNKHLIEDSETISF